MTLRLRWFSFGCVIMFLMLQLYYWYEAQIMLEGLLSK
jgi:hypothetical protein